MVFQNKVVKHIGHRHLQNKIVLRYIIVQAVEEIVFLNKVVLRLRTIRGGKLRAMGQL
jgi:hypothetical protein